MTSRERIEKIKLDLQHAGAPVNPWYINLLLTLALVAWLIFAAYGFVWASEQCRQGIPTPPMCFEITD